MSNNFNKKIKKNDKKLSLNLANIGKCYKIVDCTLPDDIQIRLFEMGLVPNTIITVLKKAPLGDPIEISVRGYSLCIRLSDAAHFTVVEVEN